MVELDVQLSKDKIPVVYHDFNVHIVMKSVRLFEVLLIPILNLNILICSEKFSPRA
jgi:glycerophosphoryl diester phosphodiesterase